jgi:hypothetical protein
MTIKELLVSAVREYCCENEKNKNETKSVISFKIESITTLEPSELFLKG